MESRHDITASNLDTTAFKLEQVTLQVRKLGSTSHGYLAARRRFLETYERDVKGDTTYDGPGPSPIAQGNPRAPGGDAVTDAVVYQADGRTDRSLYRELYGLDYREVLQHGMFN